jgi:hypothetical protein
VCFRRHALARELQNTAPHSRKTAIRPGVRNVDKQADDRVVNRPLAAGHDARRSDASAWEKPDYTRDAAELSQSWTTLLVVLMLVLSCVALWLAMR